MPNPAVIFEIFAIASSYQDFSVKILHIEDNCNELSTEIYI